MPQINRIVRIRNIKHEIILTEKSGKSGVNINLGKNLIIVSHSAMQSQN